MFALGLDYGTNSVRALIVRCADGAEVSSCVVDYPSGDQGVWLDPEDHHLARQSPADYLFGLERSVLGAIESARSFPGFRASEIVAIGVDATGSSPLPVDRRNRALALDPRYRDNANAQCWLWKDHTAWREAQRITKLASEVRPQYLARCGGVYSSEWWWAKIWRCLNAAPDVFEAAHSWVELADWIPSVLAGVEDPSRVQRGICAAGHKAMFAPEWDGLPDKAFLEQLDPRLAALRDRLYEDAHDATAEAGRLTAHWAGKLGLTEGLRIAIGAFDVHYGAIGCGVREGALVKVIGTSTCDCTVVAPEHAPGDFPGVCGVVKGAILPGLYSVEAGQSAVGDIFKWWVERICDGDARTHERLSAEAAEMRAGHSGLLALDWNNGNRTILVDQLLSGLLVGQTLYTSPAEIYRALIEATAFGARVILEHIEKHGAAIDRIVCTGGIAEKNPLLMQIYADVLGRRLDVAASSQSCALGSAIVASVLAGAHPDFTRAQAAMTSLRPDSYEPRPAEHAVYNELFALYRTLHDSFGGVDAKADLGKVMKRLIEIKYSA